MASVSLESSTSLENLLECPVCEGLMGKPKLLSCGHTICNDCLDALPCQNSRVQCPTCGEDSDKPPRGFPTNFAVLNMVTELKNQELSHECLVCDSETTSDNMAMCHSCGGVCVCLSCAVSSHSGHKTQLLDDHIKEQWEKFEEWRSEKLTALSKHTLIPTEKLTEAFKKFRICDKQASSKVRDFETRLRCLSDSKHSLTKGNGYNFDMDSLEREFGHVEKLQKQVSGFHTFLMDELEEASSEMQELAVSLSEQCVDLESPDRSKHESTRGILMVNGGQDDPSIDLYCPLTNTIQSLPIKSWNYRVSVAIGRLGDGKVVMAGGKSAGVYSHPIKRTEIVDLERNETCSGPDLNSHHCEFSGAVLDGEMYVCGGKQYGSETDVCEVLRDLRDWKWHYIPKMKTARYDHAVVALNGLIYAIGGRTTQHGLSSVESYSPVTNSWKAVAPLSHNRFGLAAAAFNGSYM